MLIVRSRSRSGAETSGSGLWSYAFFWLHPRQESSPGSEGFRTFTLFFAIALPYNISAKWARKRSVLIA